MSASSGSNGTDGDNLRSTFPPTATSPAQSHPPTPQRRKKTGVPATKVGTTRKKSPSPKPIITRQSKQAHEKAAQIIKREDSSSSDLSLDSSSSESELASLQKGFTIATLATSTSAPSPAQRSGLILPLGYKTPNVFTQNGAEDVDVFAARAAAQRTAASIARRPWEPSDSYLLKMIICDEDFRKAQTSFHKKINWQRLAKTIFNRREEEVVAQAIGLCGFHLKYANKNKDRIVII